MVKSLFGGSKINPAACAIYRGLVHEFRYQL